MFDLHEELTPEKRAKIITQITAKASWGDTKEETQTFARQEGLSAEEVTFHVNHAYLKRENFVRKAGTSARNDLKSWINCILDLYFFEHMHNAKNAS